MRITKVVTTKDPWEGTKGGDTNIAEETGGGNMLLHLPPVAVTGGELLGL